MPAHHLSDDTLARETFNRAARQYDEANYPAARRLYEEALALYETGPGETHPETLRCRHGLGQVLNAQGDFATARQWVEGVLAQQRDLLGEDHPDTAASLHTLGEIISNQGDLAGGRQAVEAAFTRRARVLGPAHPDTLDSMTLAALLLARLGDRAGAEQRLTHALALGEQALGEAHRVTGKVLTRLGVFWAAGKNTVAQARPVYERALAVNERVFGPVHPFTGLTLSNLAAVLVDLGEYTAARPLLERSLAIHEAAYGTRHPLVALVLVNLADLHRQQANYTAARPLLTRALIICEGTLGAQHPQTLTCLRKWVGLAAMLHQQAGDQQAMTVAMPLHRCLMALEAAAGRLDPANRDMPGAHLGADQAAGQLHELVLRLEADLNRPPLTPADQAGLQAARALAQQAEELSRQGQPTPAEALWQQALASQERILGADHLDHVDLLQKLAEVKEALGQPSAVLPLLQRVADIHSRVLGPDHPQTLLALTTLLNRYSYEYGPAAAGPLQQRLLDLQTEALGPDDPWVKLMRRTVEQLAAAGPPPEQAEGPVLSRSEKREQALAAPLPPERAVLLAGLADINWSTLQHAYGPAGNVPALLHMLLADDPAVREDAWEGMGSAVIHQGTVYEATAYVVPFLLKMLAYGGPPGQKELLYFLAALAKGQGYLAVHAQPNDTLVNWEKLLAQQGRGDLPTELKREADWIEAVHEAVGAGLPLYFDLLDHADDELQHLALFTLSCLRRQAAQIVPGLQGRLRARPEPGLRAGLVRALRRLMDASPATLAFLNDLVETEDDPQVIFQAAAGLVERAGRQPPKEGVPAPVLAALRTSWRAWQQEIGQGKTKDRLSWFYPAEEDEGLQQFLKSRFLGQGRTGWGEQLTPPSWAGWQPALRFLKSGTDPS